MVFPVERIKTASQFREQASVSDPLRHLVDCHDRIEQRLQTLERAAPLLRAEAEDKRREAREAMNRALEFLQIMGALHTEDEEVSLFPRLKARCEKLDPSLIELTVMLESQHREKEAVLRKLLDELAKFPAPPEPLPPEQAKRVEGLVAQIADHYRPHIMIENERLIPLSGEYLKADELAEIQTEMRARRASL